MADFSKIKHNLAEAWKEPKKRKGIIAVVIMGSVIFGVMATDDSSAQKIAQEHHNLEKVKKVQANFFSQSGANTIEKGHMDEIYGLMENQIKDRETAIDHRENEMHQLEDRLSKQIEDLRFSQTALKRDMAIQKKSEATNSHTTYGGGLLQNQAQTQPQPQPVVNGKQQSQPSQQLQPMQQVAQQQLQPRKPVVDHRRVGIRTITSSSDDFVDYNGKTTNLTASASASATAKDGATTRTIDGKKPEKKASQPIYQQESENVEPTQIILPAGTMISGILTTGMDVPTGSSTKHDPLPSILRINKDALLPNNFRADINDCVLVTSAIGDLSSSRAYLRAEALSCVTSDGVAVETSLNAFSVGPDGRNGIKGRLVSKNGEAALKSMWAGFLSGMSGLAGQTDIKMADDKTGAFSTFTDASAMGTVAGGAALKGASSAMDRLAKYYIEIVEEMRPYIEINPGIEIDFIVQRGATLKLGKA